MCLEQVDFSCNLDIEFVILYYNAMFDLLKL